MTKEEILQRYPNASAAFLARNADPDTPRICSSTPQPDERVALVPACEAKETHWYLSAKRFEITFRVYSVRPADYDGIDIKALQDFLVESQIIPDDKWSMLSGRTYSRKVTKKEDEKTVVEIIAFTSDETHT